MSRYIIIVAGGKGLRMGGDLPKQFIPMAGKPLLMHTVEAFHRWDAEARIVLALPIDHQTYWAMLCREIGWIGSVRNRSVGGSRWIGPGLLCMMVSVPLSHRR